MINLLNSKNKKAQIDLSINSLTGFVLAFFAIIATVALVVSLINLVSSDADEGTMGTVKHIAKYVNFLYDEKNTNYTSCGFKNAYLEPDWALVGFSIPGERSFTTNDRDEVEEYCGPHDDNIIRPKSKCGSKACLCVCDGGYGDTTGDDCINDGTCVKVNSKVKRFTSNLVDPNVINSDLSLYSESCWTGEDKKIQEAFLIIKDFGAPGKVAIKVSSNSELEIKKKSDKHFIMCDQLGELFKEKTVTSQTVTIAEKPKQQTGNMKNTVMTK